MKILMVCLGNICRSPLAEALFRKHCTTNKINCTIDSAGLGNWHENNPPDKRSIQVALNNHIDISNQRARKITASDFDTHDIIYAMDKSVFDSLLKLAPLPSHKIKIKLFLEEAGNSATSDVPDPYYGDINDFKIVYEMIDNASEILVNQLYKYK